MYATYGMSVECDVILLPNVPDEVSLLAYGIQACPAGEMPEVPKGQGFGRLAR